MSCFLDLVMHIFIHRNSMHHSCVYQSRRMGNIRRCISSASVWEVLFLNVDGLVDLATINAFLAYHHSKESLVIAVLADTYDMFDLRCEKSNARIVYCTLALYVRLVSHVFNHEGRFVCPLQGHRMCSGKGQIKLGRTLGRHDGSVH